MSFMDLPRFAPPVAGCMPLRLLVRPVKLHELQSYLTPVHSYFIVTRGGRGGVGEYTNDVRLNRSSLYPFSQYVRLHFRQDNNNNNNNNNNGKESG